MLTSKQESLLGFINSEKNEKGRTPTIQEMAKNFGVTNTAIVAMVRIMIRKGVLFREPRIHRGIRVVKEIDS